MSGYKRKNTVPEARGTWIDMNRFTKITNNNNKDLLWHIHILHGSSSLYNLKLQLVYTTSTSNYAMS